jgi:hypothetical protein
MSTLTFQPGVNKVPGGVYICRPATDPAYAPDGTLILDGLECFFYPDGGEGATPTPAPVRPVPADPAAPTQPGGGDGTAFDVVVTEQLNVFSADDKVTEWYQGAFSTGRVSDPGNAGGYYWTNTGGLRRDQSGVRAGLYSMPVDGVDDFYSQQAVVQDFGIDLPAHAVITGMEVELTMQDPLRLVNEEIGVILCKFSVPSIIYFGGYFSNSLFAYSTVTEAVRTIGAALFLENETPVAGFGNTEREVFLTNNAGIAYGITSFSLSNESAFRLASGLNYVPRNPDGSTNSSAYGPTWSTNEIGYFAFSNVLAIPGDGGVGVGDFDDALSFSNYYFASDTFGGSNVLWHEMGAAGVPAVMGGMVNNQEKGIAFNNLTDFLPGTDYEAKIYTQTFAGGASLVTGSLGLYSNRSDGRPVTFSDTSFGYILGEYDSGNAFVGTVNKIAFASGAVSSGTSLPSMDGETVSEAGASTPTDGYTCSSGGRIVVMDLASTSSTAGVALAVASRATVIFSTNPGNF